LDSKIPKIFQQEIILCQSPGKKINIIQEVIGDQFLESKSMKIDKNKKITIRGEFRSTGPKESYFYFGFVQYTKNRKAIHANLVLRFEDTGTIIDSLDELDGKTCFISKSISKNFKFGPDCLDYEKSIGFYFDGETNRLPDFVWVISNGETGVKGGTIRDVDRFSILCNGLLPNEVVQKIEFGKTKIIQHTSGGTHVYSGGAGLVPKEWKVFEGSIENSGDPKTSFRFEVEFVSVLILGNYRQSDDHVLEFKNISFKVEK
jgi:hypothetical protein